MTGDVKGGTPQRTRAYDSSARRARARENRLAVLRAARELVEERGFTGTTIADVARRAGVSPESVYKGFGTKTALVKEVFDVTVAGDDDAVAVSDRPESQLIRAEPDAAVKLRLFAQGAAARAERTAGLQLVLRNAAPGNAAIAELWATLQAERLTGMEMLARHLVDTGQLRADVDVDQVRDVLWTGISVEVYDLLVRQRGWEPADYATWLARMLVSSLLDPPTQAPGGGHVASAPGTST